MPDIVVHNAMGEEVLRQLKPEISALIDHDIFQFSVMGPDPYIFYRFFAGPFRKSINKRSKLMHSSKTGEFLMELAKRSQSEQMFSFLSGFLCHYALDSTTHPFIYGLSRNRAGMHEAVEHRLDVMELERQGKKRKDIMKLFTSFPELTEVKEAMNKIYGWDDSCFRTSYRHMKEFHWIIKDQSGLMNALFGRSKGKIAAFSYRNHICDGMDLSEFDHLYKESVEMAVRLVTAAYDYRRGSIDEATLADIIGNRSYAGGEAER